MHDHVRMAEALKKLLVFYRDKDFIYGSKLVLALQDKPDLGHPAPTTQSAITEADLFYYATKCLPRAVMPEPASTSATGTRRRAGLQLAVDQDKSKADQAERLLYIVMMTMLLHPEYGVEEDHMALCVVNKLAYIPGVTLDRIRAMDSTYQYEFLENLNLAQLKSAWVGIISALNANRYGKTAEVLDYIQTGTPPVREVPGTVEQRITKAAELVFTTLGRREAVRVLRAEDAEYFKQNQERPQRMLEEREFKQLESQPQLQPYSKILRDYLKLLQHKAPKAWEGFNGVLRKHIILNIPAPPAKADDYLEIKLRYTIAMLTISLNQYGFNEQAYNIRQSLWRDYAGDGVRSALRKVGAVEQATQERKNLFMELILRSTRSLLDLIGFGDRTTVTQVTVPPVDMPNLNQLATVLDNLRDQPDSEASRRLLNRVAKVRDAYADQELSHKVADTLLDNAESVAIRDALHATIKRPLPIAAAYQLRTLSARLAPDAEKTYYVPSAPRPV